MSVAENVAEPAAPPLPFTSGIEPDRTLPFQVTTAAWSGSRNRSGGPDGSPLDQKSMKASLPNWSDTLAEKNAKPPPLVADMPSQNMLTLWSVNLVTRPADAAAGRAATSTSDAMSARSRFIRVPPGPDAAGRRMRGRLPLGAGAPPGALSALSRPV